MSKFLFESFLIPEKLNLLNLNYKKMCDFFVSLNESHFRAEQVMKWIYHFYCDDFMKMSNLSLKLRKKLHNNARIFSPKFIQFKKSIDGSIKWKVMVGSKLIETVYIPEKNRSTLCVSSQVGCALKCKFCLTGTLGFYKNLDASQIIGQLWNVSKMFYLKDTNINFPITNVVFMGMGEPLLNFNNVIIALELMMHKFAFGLSKHHVTISTVGIIPALNKLSKLIDVSLAISLHATNNEIRDFLIPINKKYKIESLLYSVKQYLKNSKSNRGKVTIEYVMLNTINDHPKHAHELINLLSGIPSKVNLIPWNIVQNSKFNCSSFEKIKNFSNILNTHGLTTTIRKNRGNDIYAACGQLANII